jgi:hypothetical protein
MSMMRSFEASLLAAMVYYHEDRELHTKQYRNYVSNLVSITRKNAIKKKLLLTPFLAPTARIVTQSQHRSSQPEANGKHIAN